MFVVLTFLTLTTSSFVASYDIRCFRPHDDHDVVILTHPEDCRKFIKCDQEFNAIEKSCPPLLEFDPVLKICDWPKGYCTPNSNKPVEDMMPYSPATLPNSYNPAVQMFPNYAEFCQTYFICENNKCREESCEDGKTFESTTKQCENDAYCHEYHNTVDIQARASAPYIHCSVRHGRWYPDEDDCTKFYICANGTAYRQQCHAGQYFDRIRGLCLAGSTETCKPDPGPECKCPCGDYNDGDKLPDIFYPNKYYVCVKGVLRSRICENGFEFDANKLECIDKGATTTPETTTPKKDGCGPLAVGDKIPDSLNQGPYYYICTEEGVLKRLKCPNDYEFQNGDCFPPVITPPANSSCGSLPNGGFMPDENDESMFYVCVNGILHHKKCPDGQYFDKILLVCRASTGTTLPPELSCGDIPAGGRIPDPFDNSKYYVCINGTLEHYSCPSDYYFDPTILQCVSSVPTTTPVIQNCGSTPDGGIIPDKLDNTKYYVCAAGVLQHRTCPSGSIFDVTLLQCISNTTTTTVANKNCGATPDGGLIPDPFDDTKYYVCVQGEFQHRSCPADYVFDADRLQCITENPITTLPPEDCGPTPSGGFVPDFYDTNKFYVCSNGVLLHKSCPEDSVFDPIIMQCTADIPTPEIKDCGPTSDGAFLPDYFDKSKFYVCIQGVLQHRSCPEFTEFDEQKLQCVMTVSTTTEMVKNCGSVSNGAFIPDEFDNTKFFVCVNGVLEHKNCPNNTFFDKINLVCTSTVPTTTYQGKSCGEIPEGGFVPDEFNNTNFYVCVGGELRPMSCPAGFTFDKSKLICVATESTTTTTLPPESENCGSIPNGGFMPDEFDNTKFYVCVNGVLRQLSCPHSTVFDKDKLACVDNGTSSTTSTSSTTVTSTTSSTTSTTPSSTTTSTTTTTTTHRPGCGTGSSFIPYDDKLPDEFDPKAYYVCLPPGVLIRLTCPGDTIFSSEMKTCTPPPVTQPPGFQSCGNFSHGTILPDELNNNKFYVCVDGVLNQKTCNSNWIFDRDLLACVAPTTTSSTTTTSTTTTSPPPSTTTPSTTSSTSTSTVPVTTTTTATTTTTISSKACGAVPDGGRLPDKFNNTKFYVCVQGFLWHMTCPVGQIFDEVTLMCVSCATTTTTPSKSCGSVPDGGFLPDKLNDAWFYVCSSGVLLHKPCPIGQTFDPVLLVCKTSTTTSTLPSSTSTTTTSTTTPTTTTTTTPTITTTTTVSPNGCGPLKEGELLPDEYNINKYYVCVNGYLNHHTCPTGLIFDKENLYCYNCSTETTTSAPTTTPGPTTPVNCGNLATGDMIPDKFNNRKFYICFNGYLKHLECSHGLLFDEASSTCILPEEASTTTTAPSNNCGELAAGDILPDFNNNKMFYICVDGYLKHVACPDGLVFDKTTMSCRRPQSTTLPITTTQSTTTSTSTTTNPPSEFCPGGIANGTLVPNLNNCLAFTICINGNFMDEICPEGFFFDITAMRCAVNNGQCVPPNVTPPPSGCGSLASGEFLLDASDNKKFFVCLNGQLIAKSCDPGQVFEASTKSCITFQPSTSTTTDLSQKNCGSLKPGDFLPDEKNPKYFYICNNGQLEHRACPGDLIFDMSQLMCVNAIITSTPGIISFPSGHSDCGIIRNGEFLANIHDNSKYYVCTNGILSSMACKTGHIFNAELGVCIQKEILVTNAPLQLTTVPGIMPCKDMQSGAYKRHESDPTKYYVCVLNMLQEEKCPRLHLFDPNELYCKAIWN